MFGEGTPATGSIGLGVLMVNGRSLVPFTTYEKDRSMISLSGSGLLGFGGAERHMRACIRARRGGSRCMDRAGAREPRDASGAPTLMQARAESLRSRPTRRWITDCTCAQIFSHATFDNWVCKTVNLLRLEPTSNRAGDQCGPTFTG